MIAQCWVRKLYSQNRFCSFYQRTWFLICMAAIKGLRMMLAMMKVVAMAMRNAATAILVRSDKGGCDNGALEVRFVAHVWLGVPGDGDGA